MDVETLILAGRVDLLLQRARSASSVGARRFLADALERAVMLSDPGGVTDDARDEAESFGADPPIARLDVGDAPPHAVLVPFLAPGLGFARLLYVAWQPGGETVSLSPESRAAVDEALAAAAAHTPPPRDPAGYRLTAAQPAVVSAFDVGGRSLAAAVLVSAVALWSQRPVRRGTLVSGDLSGRSVVEVGGLTTKLEGALAGHDRLRRIVVPTRNLAEVRAATSGHDVTVVGVADVDELLDAALEVVPARFDPEEAVEDARRAFARGWQGYRWPAQREPLLRLAGAVPDRRPDLRVEVLTMLGAVTRHLGSPEESIELLERADAIVRSEEGARAVPDRPICELLQHRALTLRQLSRFDESAAAAERAVAVAEHARLRGQLLKAHGCAGLVALSRKNPEVAVEHQRAALEVVRAHRPQSAARTGGYLAEALGRAGALAEAAEVYEASLRLVSDVPDPDASRSQEAWLRISYAGVLDDPRQVLSVLDAECVTAAIERTPLPGLIARRWLGLARAQTGALDAGLSLLADSPVAYGRAQLPHVRFLAHLNVLYEARARRAHEAFGPDAASRALIALDALPSYGKSVELLGEAVERVRDALVDPALAGLDASLDRLVAECARIQ